MEYSEANEARFAEACWNSYSHSTFSTARLVKASEASAASKLNTRGKLIRFFSQTRMLLQQIRFLK